MTMKPWLSSVAAVALLSGAACADESDRISEVETDTAPAYAYEDDAAQTIDDDDAALDATAAYDNEETSTYETAEAARYGDASGASGATTAGYGDGDYDGAYGDKSSVETGALDGARTDYANGAAAADENATQTAWAGETVYTEDGVEIGQVEMMTDGEDGVERAIVSVGTYLGLGAKQIAVDKSELSERAEGGLTIALTEEEIEAAPRYVEKAARGSMQDGDPMADGDAMADDDAMSDDNDEL